MQMTIGELKKLIKNKPDNVLIVVPAEDHSYRYAYAAFEQVRFEDGGTHMSEDYIEIPMGPEDFVDMCLVIS